MEKSSLDELLEIYTQFKNHPLGRDLLEFATFHDKVENFFTNQRETIEEHIIKAQLYNDSTAYKTLWNTYSLFYRKLHRETFYRVATVENIKDWLTEELDEKDYYAMVEEIKEDTENDYPKMENHVSYQNYVTFIDYLIVSIRNRDGLKTIDTFRKEVKKLLGWDE